jgi:nucleoside-diphosphate-sugar epimerase
MRYFITGTTGFIGGKLARELVKRGHTVVTIARNPARASDLAALGIEVHKGDITDKASMRPAMTSVDGVYHVAGWYKLGTRNPQEGYDINVTGTRNVLELMRELAIPKGVYTSTLAIYGNTHGKVVDETEPAPTAFDSEYDRTKSLAHFEVALPMMREGLPLVIVQPGMVYGPGDTSQMGEAWVQYLQGKLLPMMPGGAVYAWAHVDDIVEGHILAMEKGKVGESYIIAGEVVSIQDAFDLAEQITKRSPPLWLGNGIANVMAGMLDVVNKVVPLEGQMSAEAVRSLTATYIGSNGKARRELGYAPRPLAEGLRETLLGEMARLGLK